MPLIKPTMDFIIFAVKDKGGKVDCKGGKVNYKGGKVNDEGDWTMVVAFAGNSTTIQNC